MVLPSSSSSPASTPAPAVHRGEVLRGRVHLDGERFVGCSFEGATLIYAGIGGVELSDCRFNGVSFEFIGPAAKTLGLLQAMSHPASGLRDVLKDSFPRLFAH